jgi:hypothetical protein
VETPRHGTPVKEGRGLLRRPHRAFRGLQPSPQRASSCRRPFRRQTAWRGAFPPGPGGGRVTRKALGSRATSPDLCSLSRLLLPMADLVRPGPHRTASMTHRTPRPGWFPQCPVISRAARPRPRRRPITPARFEHQLAELEKDLAELAVILDTDAHLALGTSDGERHHAGHRRIGRHLLLSAHRLPDGRTIRCRRPSR